MDHLEIGLLPEFEQQFCAVTAEITSKICVTGNNDENDRNVDIQDIENLFKDANELLDRMELEVRDVPQDQRQKLGNRVKSYEVELHRLKDEYLKRVIAYKAKNEETTRVNLFGSDYDPIHLSQGEEQRQTLLDNSEKLERTSTRLGQSFKSAIESEQVGAQILNDLQHQRSILTNSRNRLRETDEDLNQSSRILNHMTRRFVQNKFILSAVLCIVGIVIFLIIYLKFVR